jgi:DNA repair protein RecO (recombination protein O)
MRLTSVDAIPLKRMDYGEADRIVTIFTPDRGKLRVIARGVRRPMSRIAGHFELFTHDHVMLAHGRELDTVTQASCIQPFRRLHEDMAALAQTYHLAELVDSLVEDRDPHPDVFALLKEGLAALDDGEVEIGLVARHFELHLLGAVGFRPELTLCLGCATQIQPDENGYSAVRGGVFCPSCAAHEPTARSLEVDTLKLLRFLQRTPSACNIALRAPLGVGRGAERVLRRHIEHVLERRLRAAEFVRIVAETVAEYRA